MDYVDIKTARTLPGLRLVLTAGVPAPWSEAAKAILKLKQVDYMAVAQQGGAVNDELVSWTRHRNAPVALYENEAPRVRWLEILHLAERLGNGPALLPTEQSQRMSMVALVNEICGESGFAWNARLLMLEAIHQAVGDKVLGSPMFLDYRFIPGCAEHAKLEVQEALNLISDTIISQRHKGSDYLIGDSLTAADIYWVFFSQLLDPLPAEISATPEPLLRSWRATAAALEVFNPVLTEQRDLTIQKHIDVPLDF